jgi:hypothetical protein
MESYSEKEMRRARSEAMVVVEGKVARAGESPIRRRSACPCSLIFVFARLFAAFMILSTKDAT